MAASFLLLSRARFHATLIESGFVRNALVKRRFFVQYVHTMNLFAHNSLQVVREIPAGCTDAVARASSPGFSFDMGSSSHVWVTWSTSARAAKFQLVSRLLNGADQAVELAQ